MTTANSVKSTEFIDIVIRVQVKCQTEMMTFAKNLKREREINNLTQQQFADRIKVPIRSYQNYESLGTNHCEPDQELLLRIAKELNVSVGDLLGEN